MLVFQDSFTTFRRVGALREKVDELHQFYESQLSTLQDFNVNTPRDVIVEHHARLVERISQSLRLLVTTIPHRPPPPIVPVHQQARFLPPLNLTAAQQPEVLCILDLPECGNPFTTDESTIWTQRDFIPDSEHQSSSCEAQSTNSPLPLSSASSYSSSSPDDVISTPSSHVGNKRSRFTSLNAVATRVMTRWYTQNAEHPYPSYETAEVMAKAGGITVEQVKKWFANQRLRRQNTKSISEIARRRKKTMSNLIVDA